MLNQLPFWQGRYEENSNIARAKNDKPWVEEATVLFSWDEICMYLLDLYFYVLSKRTYS